MILQYFKQPTIAELEATTGLKIKRLSTGQIKDGNNFREGIEIEVDDKTSVDLGKLDAMFPAHKRKE